MSVSTKQRLKKPAEFRSVFSRARRASNSLLSVALATNELGYPRVGLSVSKRVGSAVTRNLLKRRLRSSFAGLDLNEGYDVVISAKPESATASYRELDGAVQTSIKRAGSRKVADQRRGER